MYAFLSSKNKSWVLQDNTLRDTEIYDMDSHFDIALHSFKGTFRDFDIRSFTSRYIVLPNAQHILKNSFLSKSVQDMDIKFDMITGQKIVLIVCNKHGIKIFS